MVWLPGELGMSAWGPTLRPLHSFARVSFPTIFSKRRKKRNPGFHWKCSTYPGLVGFEQCRSWGVGLRLEFVSYLLCLHFLRNAPTSIFLAFEYDTKCMPPALLECICREAPFAFGWPSLYLIILSVFDFILFLLWASLHNTHFPFCKDDIFCAIFPKAYHRYFHQWYHV